MSILGSLEESGMDGHQGGPLVRMGEGKAGAIQAGGTAVEVLWREDWKGPLGVRRPAEAWNPTDALGLASGR